MLLQNYNNFEIDNTFISFNSMLKNIYTNNYPLFIKFNFKKEIIKILLIKDSFKNLKITDFMYMLCGSISSINILIDIILFYLLNIRFNFNSYSKYNLNYLKEQLNEKINIINKHNIDKIDKINILKVEDNKDNKDNIENLIKDLIKELIEINNFDYNESYDLISIFLNKRININYNNIDKYSIILKKYIKYFNYNNDYNNNTIYFNCIIIIIIYNINIFINENYDNKIIKDENIKNLNI